MAAYARSEKARKRWTAADPALVLAELQKNEAAIAKLRGVQGRIPPFEIVSTAPAEEQQAKPAGRLCAASGCSNVISPTARAHARYCSDTCRDRAYKARRAEVVSVAEEVESVAKATDKPSHARLQATDKPSPERP